MALDRTWYNTLLNDDGSNTVGSSWDKEDVDALMDAVDAEIVRLDADIAGGAGAPTEQTTTATGTQNNFSLSGRFTYLRCNNASAVTFTGFTVGGSAPQAGDRVIIDNVGSSTVKVAYQDSGSTAAHRAITPSTAGQIVGGTGRMECVYDDSTDRWREAVIEPGAPISFTPVLGGSVSTSGQVYGSQTGLYQQRGREFFATVQLGLTTKGTISGILQIQGLPLAPTGVVNFTVTYWEALVTGLTFLAGINGGGGNITLYGVKGSAVTTSVTLDTNDIGNTSLIRGATQYIID
jgi:hypothetical protein